MSASTVSYFAALLLCVSFFLQGVNYAQADTVDGSDSAPAPSVAGSQPQPEPEVNEEETELQSEVVPEESEEPEVPLEVVDVDTATESADTEDDLNTTVEPEDVVLEPSANAGGGDTEEVLNEDGETAEAVDASETEEVVEDEEGESATTTDEVVDDETNSADEFVNEDEVIETEDSAETATTTELIEEELLGTAESVSVVQSDTAYTFNREECTKLATGSFYCLKPVEYILEDALFAAPDEDGDLEIFLVRDGVQSQVTQNQVDDAAPYFDENSNTIVWHRLHNDRFQIVSYEIDSGDETLLTSTSENNMEPTRQGDYTVWQRWVDGSWNIILHDGQNETKLTNNGGHNVAPYVHGSLVVWNRHNTDGQKTIEMYDIDTRSYVSVPDAEGLSVSNPRMVFVFDSLTPEGDIITKGYDVLSRKFIDLDSLPVNLPDEIPNSDSTGETRALIQSKPTVKTDIEELIESEPEVPTVGPEPELEALTLNLATSTAEVATTSVPIVESMAEFELIIEPYNGTTTSSSSEQTSQ